MSIKFLTFYHPNCANQARAILIGMKTGKSNLEAFEQITLNLGFGLIGTRLVTKRRKGFGETRTSAKANGTSGMIKAS